MLKSGLVSITFRQLGPVEIVDLVKQAGLDGIEWGGDVHVPHGKLKTAKEVKKITEEAGLQIPSYGSYYRIAESYKENLDFRTVLDTAIELGAPLIRVWAGRQSSADADNEYRTKAVEESREIATLAQLENIAVAYEYHGNTLTDTNESALDLLKEVNHDNIFSYWQPPNQKPFKYCLQGLEAILSKLAHLHVFYWTYSDCQRTQHALSEGEEVWRKYLQTTGKSEKDHFAMIEFVKGNQSDQFLQDAATLKGWLKE